MFNKRLIAVALATFVLTSALSAAGGSKAEERQHFVIAQRDRTPLYYATTISASGQAASRETYLLESTSGQRIRIDVSRNYQARQVVTSYKLNDGPPVTVTLKLPGNATTRAEMIEEYKENPTLQNANVPIEIHGPNGIAKVLEQDWIADRNGSRDKVRQVRDPGLSAALQPLGSVIALPQFAGACSTVGLVSTGAVCVADTGLMIAAISPDCDFDARFGEACTPDQQVRAKSQPMNPKRPVY